MRFQPDYDRLFTKARELRTSFESAKPFPHVVIDNFLDAPAYAAARECYPAPNHPIWRRFDTVEARAKSVSEGTREPLLKEMDFDPAAKDMLRELNSAAFLRFLETVSGIQGLTSDPYFIEGGFHMIDQGGFLDIHADFSHHGHTGFDRRLNLLFYLNDDWRPEYGGELGLYDTELREVQSILPIGNRVAIFATSKTSYHGHPRKMTNPPGTFRRSIALYYYSMPRAERVSRGSFFRARNHPWAGLDRSQIASNIAVKRGDVFFAHPDDIKQAVDYALTFGQDTDFMSKNLGQVMSYLAKDAIICFNERNHGRFIEIVSRRRILYLKRHLG